MLKDVTLGQFFPGNTVVHRLDPRTKLIWVILYIVALFNAYVSGRSPLNFPLRVPVVLLDMPNWKHDGENQVTSVLGNSFTLKCRGNGETLYSPVDQLLENMEAHGMTKAHAGASFHRIDVTDQSGVARVVEMFAAHQLEALKALRLA